MKVGIVGSGFVGATADVERFTEDLRGKLNQIPARIALHAARKRGAGQQPSTKDLPKREVPDSYVYERRWGFLWRRPTLNTRMRRILD